MRAATLGSGMPSLRGVAPIALAVQYTGAAAFPIAMIAIWRRFAGPGWRQNAARILEVFSIVSGAAIALTLWFHLLPLETVVPLTAFNAGLLLIAGPLLLLQRDHYSSLGLHPLLRDTVRGGRDRHRRDRGASFSRRRVLAVTGFRTRTPGAAGDGSGIPAVCAIPLCGPVHPLWRSYFAVGRVGVRDRYSGAIGVHDARGEPYAIARRHARFSGAGYRHRAAAFVYFCRRANQHAVSRMMFRAPDYREAARQFTNQVRDLHQEPKILGALEEAARVPLGLEAAQVVAAGDLPWPQGDRGGRDHGDRLSRSAVQTASGQECRDAGSDHCRAGA